MSWCQIWRGSAACVGCAAASLLLLLAGCVRTRAPEPKRASQAARYVGPPPPTGGLPIPALDVPVDPPRLVAGDPLALRRALVGATGARLISPLGPDLAAMAFIEASLLAGGSARSAASACEALGPCPLRPQRRPAPDALGFVETSVTARVLDSPGPVVIVDWAPVDAEHWAALAPQTRGSCEPILGRLALGQELSLARLDPFLDQADNLVASVFTRDAAQALEPYTALADPAQVLLPKNCEDRRGDYGRRVARLRSCVESGLACEFAPRLFVGSRLRIGMASPEPVFDPGCTPRRGGEAVVDPADALVEAGRASATRARSALHPRWLALAARMAALTEVAHTLEELCAPRRRRLSPQALTRARETMAEIGAALASAAPPRAGAGLVADEGSFNVAGRGAAESLMRYDAGPHAPSSVAEALAVQLRDDLLDRPACGAQGQVPLVVAVAPSGSGPLSFLGFYYAEELSCAGVPTPE